MILEYETRTPRVGDTVWTITRDNSGVPTGMMEGKVLRLSIGYRFLTVVPPVLYPAALSKDVETTSNLFKLIGTVLSKEKTDDTFDKILDMEISDCVRFPYGSPKKIPTHQRRNFFISIKNPQGNRKSGPQGQRTCLKEGEIP